MKFFFHRKGAFSLMIVALLLVLQPQTITPFSPAPGPEEHASHHRCGCAQEIAATGACGCAVRHCCSCCTGTGEKSSLSLCHPRTQDHSLIYIRAFSCGGSEEVDLNSYGIKFILAEFQVSPMVNSVFFTEDTFHEPEKLSRQPSVPPPEMANPRPLILS